MSVTSKQFSTHIHCKCQKISISSTRFLFSGFHASLTNYLSKGLRKWWVGLESDVPATQEVKRKRKWFSNVSSDAEKLKRYEQLNRLEMDRVEMCSRHLYPGYFVGHILGGRVMFHQNYHTGDSWVSGSSRLLRYCSEPDPPFMATQVEVDVKYKPKRIR